MKTFIILLALFASTHSQIIRIINQTDTTSLTNNIKPFEGLLFTNFLNNLRIDIFPCTCDYIANSCDQYCCCDTDCLEVLIIHTLTSNISKGYKEQLGCSRPLHRIRYSYIQTSNFLTCQQLKLVLCSKSVQMKAFCPHQSVLQDRNLSGCPKSPRYFVQIMKWFLMPDTFLSRITAQQVVRSSSIAVVPQPQRLLLQLCIRYI